VSIAVCTSWRHFEWSCTHIHAVLRPRLWGWRSSLIVRSHICLGQPARHHQSAGGRLMAAQRMREWSCDGLALARCLEQMKASLCDNWSDWRLTCSTPHFFVRYWCRYRCAPGIVVSGIIVWRGIVLALLATSVFNPPMRRSAYAVVTTMIRLWFDSSTHALRPFDDICYDPNWAACMQAVALWPK